MRRKQRIKDYYRIGEVAKIVGVCSQTIRNYMFSNKLKYEVIKSRQRIVRQEHLDEFLNQGKDNTEQIVFYVRSSKGSSVALNNQIEELSNKYGKPIHVYRDSGSGLNENRKGLLKLLHDAKQKKFNVLCICHEDRLTRFGFSYLENLLSELGVKIEVLYENSKESKEPKDTTATATLESELMADFMALIASFAGRFYRLRSTEAKLKLLDLAKNEVNKTVTLSTKI